MLLKSNKVYALICSIMHPGHLILTLWHQSCTDGTKGLSFPQILNYFSEAFLVPEPDGENMDIWSDSMTYH